MDNIEKKISNPALYEQLAEEATELAHAALKYARILREENPTTVLQEDGYCNLIEEFTDVVNVSRVLKIPVDELQIQTKNERWENRLLNKERLDRLERVFGPSI